MAFQRVTPEASAGRVGSLATLFTVNLVVVSAAVLVCHQLLMGLLDADPLAQCSSDTRIQGRADVPVCAQRVAGDLQQHHAFVRRGRRG